MASRKLLFARVAVIDQHQEPVPVMKDLGNALHPIQRRQRRFQALVLLRLNTVAIETFHLRRRWRSEGFNESSLLHADMHGAVMIHYFNRQRVEELVAEDDEV